MAHDNGESAAAKVQSLEKVPERSALSFVDTQIPF